MIITPDMPREAGSTVEFSGALIDLMDIEDLAGTGIKVGFSSVYYGPHVTLDVDSASTSYRTVANMTADDAEHLAGLLLAAAKKAREY